jgi:hypothetical protein
LTFEEVAFGGHTTRTKGSRSLAAKNSRTNDVRGSSLVLP